MAADNKGKTPAAGPKARNREAEPEAKTPESDVAALARFLVSANRIGSRLQLASAFESAKANVPDWLLLRAIKDHGPIVMADAARFIGVTRQRVQQQVSDLGGAGFLAMSDRDGKSREISLSPGGQEQLERLEASLLATLCEAGAERLRPVHTASRSAHRLAKALNAKKAKLPGPEGSKAA